MIKWVCLCLTLTSLFWWQSTHPSTHGSESTQVFLQTLVSLLVQPSHSPELGPVELTKGGVKNNTKGGNDTIEVSFFPPGPSETHEKKKIYIYLNITII